VRVWAQGSTEAADPGAPRGIRLPARVNVAPAREPLRELWTTEAGVRAAFAHTARFVLRPGGDAATRSNPAAEPGRQGGEVVVLPAVQPMAMLCSTGKAPSEVPAVRRPRTLPKVRLHALGPRATRATRLRRTQDGWGRGDMWNQSQACFRRAGRRALLPLLGFRSEHGPLDGDQLSEDLQPAAPG